MRWVTRRYAPLTASPSGLSRRVLAIIGQSGSGKSTCMNIIGCLDVPTRGTYLLNGQDVSNMSDDEQAEIRNEMLGFIFQQYNLLPKLSVLENVKLPLLYRQAVPSTSKTHVPLKPLKSSGSSRNVPTCRHSFRAASSRGFQSPAHSREIHP